MASTLHVAAHCLPGRFLTRVTWWFRPGNKERSSSLQVFFKRRHRCVVTPVIGRGQSTTVLSCFPPHCASMYLSGPLGEARKGCMRYRRLASTILTSVSLLALAWAVSLWSSRVGCGRFWWLGGVSWACRGRVVGVSWACRGRVVGGSRAAVSTLHMSQMCVRCLLS